MPNFFPIKTTGFNVSTTAYHPLRSHSLHSTVKHCFEFAYINSVLSYHIGFSPDVNERKMVTFYRASNIIYLFETLGDASTHKYYQRSWKEIDDESWMVCLDTTSKQILAINNNFEVNSSYIYFNDQIKWHIIFDGSQDASSNPCKMNINLGYEPFKNSLPLGFKPWIHGVDEFQGIVMPHLQCTCFTAHRRLFFIFTLIIY